MVACYDADALRKGVDSWLEVNRVADAYDPLDYDNLAGSVVDALLNNDPGPLPPLTPFVGCGVYAIYYKGKLPFYSYLSSEKCRRPIYVGEAVPSGSRKGS